MKLISYFLLFSLLFVSALNGKTLYVSTTGSDTSKGTIDQPFKTITKALTSSIVAGDSIIVRGGVYTLTTTITINTNISGKQDTLCYLFAYPGERPVLDFSTQAYGSKGLQIKAKYWYIKGFDVVGAGDNGIYISGSFNIVEFCSTSKNQDSGMQLGGGANNNKIINCDSFFNQDPTEGNSDGFSPKLDVGTNNYFYGCRSWQNTDDGFDGYLRPSNNITTTLDNCWSFMNGYRRDGTISPGNGNGFKMGGSDNKLLEHNFILYNCLSFDNKAKGFDQNNNKGSMTLINCTGYRNGAKNYSVVTALDSGKALTVTNCLVYGPLGSLVLAVLTTNSWMLPDSVSSSDFVSLDTSGVRGPRKPDGNLPEVNFMHLAGSSKLIDAGTIVPGRPYNGFAPDLGAFEFGATTPVELTTFTAITTAGKVTLYWKTATEINNRGFEIQRKIDNNSWIIIAFKNGYGTSTSSYEYTLTDNISNLKVNKIFYRLRQVDFNGHSQYSPVVLVDKFIPESYSVSQNFPNPFNPSTQIVYQVPVSGHVTLTVFNTLGKEVAKLVNEDKIAGSYYIQFNADNLASGIYFYNLKTENYSQTKKMILLK
jgi:hypothetical protein